MSNKITIQRALTTIKLFEKNFDPSEKLDSATVVSKGQTVQGESAEEFKFRFDSNFKSTEDKLKYIFKLRSAIHESNLSNFIEVPHLGKITIADAIVYRNNILPKLKEVIGVMKRQYNSAIQRYEQMYNRWQTEFTEVISKFNNSDNASTDEYRQVMIKEYESREPTILFDKELYDRYCDLVSFFEEELDIQLSEHNASTIISVE